MAVPTFSTKEWKKTRPDSLKDSGMAKAISKFEKVCKLEASRLVESKDFLDYQAAIDVMAEAIATAQAKTKGKGAHDDVKTLLADWKRQLDTYRGEVEQANRLAMESTALSLYNEKLRTAVEAYLLTITNNVEMGFEKTEKAIKDFTAAVKAGNLTQASLQYDRAQSGLNDVQKNLADKQIKFQKQIEAKKCRVKVNDMTDPPNKKKWLRDLKKYDGLMDKFDRAFAALEAKALDDDTDAQDGSAEAKQILKEVQRRYKEIAAEVKSKVGQAKKFARDAGTVLTVCEHPNLTSRASAQLNRAVQSARKLNQDMQTFEQEIADLLGETRNTSSPTRKRALDAGITKRDQDAMLTPLMNVAYKNNKASIIQLRQAKGSVEKGLETLVERFDFDPARQELDNMEKGDYKITTGLG